MRAQTTSVTSRPPCLAALYDMSKAMRNRDRPHSLAYSAFVTSVLAIGLNHEQKEAPVARGLSVSRAGTLCSLERSLRVVDPPVVVVRGDRAAVLLEGEMVADCRPGQVVGRCIAGRADGVH